MSGLPAVLQAVKPYMSHKDNDAGGLWDHIITSDPSWVRLVCSRLCPPSIKLVTSTSNPAW